MTLWRPTRASGASSSASETSTLSSDTRRWTFAWPRGGRARGARVGHRAASSAASVRQAHQRRRHLPRGALRRAAQAARADWPGDLARGRETRHPEARRSRRRLPRRRARRSALRPVRAVRALDGQHDGAAALRGLGRGLCDSAARLCCTTLGSRAIWARAAGGCGPPTRWLVLQPHFHLGPACFATRRVVQSLLSEGLVWVDSQATEDGGVSCRAQADLIRALGTWRGGPEPAVRGRQAQQQRPHEPPAPRFYFQSLWTAPPVMPGGGGAGGVSAVVAGGAVSPGGKPPLAGAGGGEGGGTDGVLRDDDTDD